MAIAIPLALAGCATTSAEDDAAPGAVETTTSSAAPGVEGTITVLAAASLTESFTEIADLFMQENPSATVTLSFGGSSDLAAQIVSGSPADVFAAASPTTMMTVTDASLTATDPVDFVSNTLEIAVPVGNPGSVTGIDDFANEDLSIALCAIEVPCGSAADKLFTALDITEAPDTLEPDVKSVLSKVELDEVDAGLVYKTDVLAAGDKVEGIEFPESSEAVNLYPIAPLADSEAPDAAAAFVAYVLSEKGQAVLAAAGFGTP
jgi:molybdate transport system substrate-binding protein